MFRALQQPTAYWARIHTELTGCSHAILSSMLLSILTSIIINKCSKHKSRKAASNVAFLYFLFFNFCRLNSFIDEPQAYCSLAYVSFAVTEHLVGSLLFRQLYHELNVYYCTVQHHVKGSVVDSTRILALSVIVSWNFWYRAGWAYQRFLTILWCIPIQKQESRLKGTQWPSLYFSASLLNEIRAWLVQKVAGTSYLSHKITIYLIVQYGTF